MDKTNINLSLACYLSQLAFLLPREPQIYFSQKEFKFPLPFRQITTLDIAPLTIVPVKN